MHPTLINIDLQRFSIFEDFDPDQVQKVLSYSSTLELAPGEILIESGKANETLYLLLEGELKIEVENEGSKVSFPIHPGDCLGEMSLILDRPTSAKAISSKASRVICIPEQTFWEEVALTRYGIRNLMATMASRLRRANHSLIQEIEDQLKYKHLEKELESAGKIQSGIVPNGTNLLNQCAGVDAHAFIKQAREVGGDFYDAMLLDDERIYFAIGDVSGKGMPAALFMMRIFTSLRMLINNTPQVEKVIPNVNNLLSRNNEDMMFVTLFTGILNIRTGVLKYINAGHNSPFLSMGGAKFSALTDRSGPLLGVVENANYTLGELQLSPGDAILLYTDGVSEAMNSEEEMFEMERMEKVLNQYGRSSMHRLTEQLSHALDQFVGDAPQHDDFTVLALRYLGIDTELG